MAASADGRYVYVANKYDGTISVIDTTDDSVTTITATDPTVDHPDLNYPYGLTIFGNRLYVANEQNGGDPALPGEAGQAVAVIDIDPTSTTFHTVIGTLNASPNIDDPRAVAVWPI